MSSSYSDILPGLGLMLVLYSIIFSQHSERGFEMMF